MYKNIYRALKAFYLILTCLNYNERKKLINVFTFSLKSYYVKFNNIIKVFLQIYSEIES